MDCFGIRDVFRQKHTSVLRALGAPDDRDWFSLGDGYYRWSPDEEHYRNRIVMDTEGSRISAITITYTGTYEY